MLTITTGLFTIINLPTTNRHQSSLRSAIIAPLETISDKHKEAHNHLVSEHEWVTLHCIIQCPCSFCKATELFTRSPCRTTSGAAVTALGALQLLICWPLLSPQWQSLASTCPKMSVLPLSVLSTETEGGHFLCEPTPRQTIPKSHISNHR